MNEQIIQVLERLDKHLTNEYLKDGPVNISFASGHTGVAMFYGYYFLLTKDSQHQQKCAMLVDRLIDHISTEEHFKLTLCDGLAGVCFCINHLIKLKVIEGDDDIFEEADEFILRTAIGKLAGANYDLLHGGIGMALYLFHRSNGNYDSLTPLVEALNRSSLKNDDGLFWIDSVTQLGKEGNIPKVNFGLAHGITSIAGFLGHLVKKNAGGNLAQDVLRNTVSFLTRNSNYKEWNYVFPSTVPAFKGKSVEELRQKNRSRLAWCYGDLGISLPLMRAAEALKDNELNDLALWAAHNSLKKTRFEETAVNDGGLCHGYASVSHIYNRLYLKTKDQQFEEGSRRWLNGLLRYIDFHGGIENFKSYNGESQAYELSHGFLTGGTGAGLTLISIMDKNIDPAWDQWLMLS